MSTSIRGTFVDVRNKEVLCTAWLDYLKRLNITGRFGGMDVVPTGTAKSEDFPSVVTSVESDFDGYIRIEALSDETLKGLLTKKPCGGMKNSVIIEEDDLEAAEDIIDSYRFTPTKEWLNSTEGDSKKYDDIASLFIRKSRECHGQWYRAEDFVVARTKADAEVAEKSARYYKLTLMKDTKEWFEMSDEARGNLYNEIEWAKEAMEDAMYDAESLREIIAVMGFLSDMKNVDDTIGDDTEHLERTVEVYIEVL